MQVVPLEPAEGITDATIRVLIADDNPVFLAAASSLLRLHRHLHVVGRMVSGNDTIKQAMKLRPDVLLIDPFSPDATLWDVIRRVKKQLPDTRVVVLSDRGDGPYRDLVKSMGADAFVLKDEIGSRLVTVMEDLLTGFTMGTEKRS